MKEGDIVWARAVVSKVTPNALLLVFTGPGGAPVTYAVDPKGPIEPEAKPVSPG